ncbi:pentatricopeptide repeat-containing protein At5g39350-like [Juglans microcarpa x Juglans regia]|uniref:pentatricopeptide repeat-containing protein At5g39350-like n=1 Tax=Juglans microcarpa x Juglans regia TaxID=2249226 RepID=UPI001B7E79AB|nr:pentatricopeptide repeat-containing protein At5g39350-like [Juglans microcarpa x Juglans regia]
MNGASHALSKTKQLLATTAARCQSLFRNFAATRSLTKIKQLHAHTIISGLLSSSKSTGIRSAVAAAYALCGDVRFARKLFDEVSDRSLFLYNVVIRMYIQNGLPYDALNVFVQLLASGQCRPDNFTYPFVIKACGDLSLLNVGVVVHGRTLVAGFDSDTFVQNSLLAMYMNCGEKEAARQVFDTMREWSVVSWNTMINGYFRNGCPKEATMIFNWMMDVGVEPDCATMVSVLPACAYFRDLVLGRRINALLEEKGLGKNIAVKNALVDMYAKCGSMDEARLVFDNMGERDVVTWTTMINGYILNVDARSALALCRLMQSDGVRPNSVSIASLLSACGSLCSIEYGRCLHGWAIRQKIESDVIVETALIDMYAKCKKVYLIFRVFGKTTKKRTVPWNALLSGCIHNGLAIEAMKIFKQMLMEAVQPNEATLNSLLPAYAILADLQQASNIHCYLVRSGFLASIEVATGMIDIYSKCGSLESAHQIFRGVPEKRRDIVLWSVIIAGYGVHGHGEIAVSLFYQMVQSGVKPNEVTFTSVLHACSHAGLVDKGLHLFKFMLENHQMSPCPDHYTCIIDLLGRAGRLNEAYDLIRTMPFKPNHAVWGALLGACVIHENVELGEVSAKWLFELEPENTGNYVLMAKIYAALGRWKDAENVRGMMNEIGLKKAPAHSLVDVRSL